MSVGTILLIILVIALLGGFSGLGGAPLVHAAADRKNLCGRRPVARVQLEQWIRARIAEPRLLGIRMLADRSPFNQWCCVFTRSQAFSPAKPALHSHINNAILSSCASRDGAIGRHL